MEKKLSHFKVKSKLDLDKVNVGDRIEESDFCTITPSGNFVQLEHIEEDNDVEKYQVKPGTWSIQQTSQGLRLNTTSFSKEDLLESFISTKKITDSIDKFFEKEHVYKEFGIEVAKRGVLLYGPPGGGKSSAIKKVAEKYAGNQDTAVVLWSTDQINASDVKEFIKSFEYQGVRRLILVAEDIGGVEIDQVKMKSSSSLLALLDNQEKAFRITTLILATTNYPEVFLGNLTNRPGRFDTKIEVGTPGSSERKALLRFFLKEKCTESLEDKIGLKRYSDFSAAHLKEVALRSAIYDISLEEAVDQIAEEIKFYKDMFQKKQKLGIQSPNAYEEY